MPGSILHFMMPFGGGETCYLFGRENRAILYLHSKWFCVVML